MPNSNCPLNKIEPELKTWRDGRRSKWYWLMQGTKLVFGLYALVILTLMYLKLK